MLFYPPRAEGRALFGTLMDTHTNTQTRPVLLPQGKIIFMPLKNWISYLSKLGSMHSGVHKWWKSSVMDKYKYDWSKLQGFQKEGNGQTFSHHYSGYNMRITILTILQYSVYYSLTNKMYLNVKYLAMCHCSYNNNDGFIFWDQCFNITHQFTWNRFVKIKRT